MINYKLIGNLKEDTLTKRIETHKEGFFKFTSAYSKESRKIQGLLFKLDEMHKWISDTPILPNWAASMENDFIKSSIFSTAAIEGNPLNEEEVSQIVDEGISHSDLKDASKTEISNLRQIYSKLRSVGQPESEGYNLDLSESMIKSIHHDLTLNVPDKINIPGQYRNQIVYVGDERHGGRYTPPKNLDDIKILMSQFIDWINSDEIKELGPVIRAGLAHYYVVLIHPFGDGNGRTARFLEALLLKTSGVKFISSLLSNFYYREIDNYFISISETTHLRNKENDISPILAFIMECMTKALNEIKSRVNFFTKFLVFKDHLRTLRKSKEITKRQYDFMEVLIDSSIFQFKFSDIYEKASMQVLFKDTVERTAKRAVDKLCQMKLLKKITQGEYQINFELK